jgi:CHAT domain-containing protein/tetratricopeptide (TPR) repeat protein
MSMAVRACALLLATATTLEARTARAQHPATISAAAERALEGGEIPALRQEWADRARRSSGADREALFGLATIARLTYDYRTSDSLFTQLLSAKKSDAVHVWAHHGRAASFASRWRTADADTALAAVAAEARAAGERRSAVLAMSALATIRSRTQGVPAGMALVDEARQLVTPDDTVGLASIMATRGAILLARGDPSGPAVADSTRVLARAAHLTRIEGAAYLLLAREELRVAHTDSAVALFGAAADRFKRAGDRSTYAGSLQWRGYVLQTHGRLGDALHDLETARAVGDTAGPLVLGWTYLDLGQLALRLADYTTAVRHLAKGRELLLQVGDQWGVASTLREEATGRMMIGEWAMADSLLAEAQGRLTNVGITSEAAVLRVDRLVYAIGGENWPLAERMLAEAKKPEQRKLLAEPMNVEYYEGMLALRRGRTADAVVAFRRARANSGTSKVDVAYRPIARAAEAFARLGQLDSAEVLLRKAMDDLETWRRTMNDRGSRLAALMVNGDETDPSAGIGVTIGALARGGRVDAAFELAERSRSRELLDGMRRREARLTSAVANDSSHATAVSASYARTSSLAEVSASLPDSTALIELVTGSHDTKTTALVVTRAGAKVVTLTEARTLVDPILRLRSSIEAGVMPTALVRSLGDTVLAPMLPALEGISRLVIVTAPPFELVPFDVLALPDGRLAIERFEISYASSASIAMLLAKRPPRGAAGSLLALGAPALGRGGAQLVASTSRNVRGGSLTNLAPLPGAEREAREVTRFSRRATALTGERATEAALKSSPLRDVSVLHFATHAVVDPDAMRRTALLLAPSKDEDGVVGPEELGMLPLDADLVVLAACRTAESQGHFGDEGLLGVTAPLLEAGARSVVSTMWELDDERAAPVIDSLYSRMAAGARVGAALRQAKLAAMRQGVAPREWASLALWGDPLARPALEPPRRIPVALAATGLAGFGLLVLGAMIVRRRRA